MYRWGLFEGKDQPKELVSTEFKIRTGTQTVDFIQRTIKPLWGTGKTVITDSDFCVFRGFIDMLERGIYGSTLTKNYGYWTTEIYGDGINYHGEK